MCEILTYWLNHHKRISLSNGSKWLETDWGIILALLKELPRPWKNCNLNRRMECCARTNERPYWPYHWFGLREMWRTRNPPFPRPSMNVCFLQVSPEPILGGYLRWKIWQNCLPRIVSWICRIGWFRVHEHIFKNVTVTVQHTWPTVIWYSDIVGHSILWYNRVLHYITFHSARFQTIPLYTILHCTTWNCSSGHYVSFIHIALHYPNIIIHSLVGKLLKTQQVTGWSFIVFNHQCFGASSPTPRLVWQKQWLPLDFLINPSNDPALNPEPRGFCSECLILSHMNSSSESMHHCTPQVHRSVRCLAMTQRNSGSKWFQVACSSWFDLHVFEDNMGAKMSISGLMQVMTCNGIPMNPWFLLILRNKIRMISFHLDGVWECRGFGSSISPCLGSSNTCVEANTCPWDWRKTTPQPHFVNRVAQIIPPQKLFPPTRWDHFNYTWRGLHCSWMDACGSWPEKTSRCEVVLHGASWMVIFEGMSVWGCQAPLENTYM